MIKRLFILTFLVIIIGQKEIQACSIFYFIDKTNGKIYAVNNEDYWYNVNAYIQITPKSKDEFARLWYGWNNFAQGGVNELGLFFDGAVTPKQELPKGYHNPKGRNIGDEILAKCKSVDDAIEYLEHEKIALIEGHIIFGDKSGNAAVLEWVKGEKKIVRIKDNMLIATNYLLSDTTAGNFPCYRYQSIEERLTKLTKSTEILDLKNVGNAIGGAVQLPQKDAKGNLGGTLYTTFINITDMELVIIYKLDNAKIIKYDLTKEFETKSKQKIKLK